MYEIFTYGRFEVAPENEEAFIEAWSVFAAWASVRPGSPTIRLMRDVRSAGRFVSLGRWEDAEAIQAWKSSDEFRERLERGERPAVEEYVRLHPQHAGVIRNLLTSLEFMGLSAPGSSGPGASPALRPRGTPVPAGAPVVRRWRARGRGPAPLPRRT